LFPAAVLLSPQIVYSCESDVVEVGKECDVDVVARVCAKFVGQDVGVVEEVHRGVFQAGGDPDLLTWAVAQNLHAGAPESGGLAMDDLHDDVAVPVTMRLPHVGRWKVHGITRQRGAGRGSSVDDRGDALPLFEVAKGGVVDTDSHRL
jgi:hypothetical protein